MSRLRHSRVCVQRAVPTNALSAEQSAADWMRSMSSAGVYATLTTTRSRTAIHQLSARCEKLARALVPAANSSKEHGRIISRSLRMALSSNAWLQSLPGDGEMHITVRISDDDEELRVHVQPSPPPPGSEAALSLPREQAAAPIRADRRRGSAGGWATPLVHPSLTPIEDAPCAVEETLLHEAGTDRVVEGLNSNLFVVMADGSVRTASAAEGAYTGSMRQAVLALLAGQVIERAPSAAGLAAGEWREAWLTSTCRTVAPLSRIWRPAPRAARFAAEDAAGAALQHGAGEWIELPSCERGGRLRELLREQMARDSEPIACDELRE